MVTISKETLEKVLSGLIALSLTISFVSLELLILSPSFLPNAVVLFLMIGPATVGFIFTLRYLAKSFRDRSIMFGSLVAWTLASSFGVYRLVFTQLTTELVGSSANAAWSLITWYIILPTSIVVSLWGVFLLWSATYIRTGQGDAFLQRPSVLAIHAYLWGAASIGSPSNLLDIFLLNALFGQDVRVQTSVVGLILLAGLAVAGLSAVYRARLYS